MSYNPNINHHRTIVETSLRNDDESRLVTIRKRLFCNDNVEE